MILHIVLLRTVPNVSDESIASLRVGLIGLQTQIPGIVRIDVGPNTSPEGLSRGFELGFVVTFEDSTARDRYLPHPAHLAVVPLVQVVASDVLVFDIETRDQLPGAST